MPNYRVIRVIVQRDYLIPMADARHSLINGWTLEEIQQDWFQRFDINSSHASRDAYRAGNGDKVLTTMVIDDAAAGT